MPELFSITVTADLAEDDDRSESQEAVLRDRAARISRTIPTLLDTVLSAAFEDEGAVHITFEE